MSSNLDYSRVLKNSVLSINESGHSGFMQIEAIKWITDLKACEIINKTFFTKGFVELGKMSDVQTRILLSLLF